jgi:apolipoprotein N-acyltransferase
LLSGVLVGLSFPKFGHPAVAWVALAPLLVAVGLEQAAQSASRRRRGSRFFLLGWLTGFVGSAIAIYWVVGVMAIYGGFAPWLAVPIGALLWCYLGLFTGAAALVTGWAVWRFGVAGLWAAPATWVAAEWLRSWLFGGFPWALFGTSQAHVLPVVQLASVTGVYGLSGLLVVVSTAAAAVALSRRPRHLRVAAGVAGLLVLVVGGGVLRIADGRLTESGTPLRVGIVQGSVPIDLKFDPAYGEGIVRRYLALSRQVIGSGARLVVWPESSTPFFFNLDAVRALPIRQLAVETRTPFIIGTDDTAPLSGAVPPPVYNASIVLGADGRSHGVYRKVYLAPFGEFVPFKRLLFFVGPLIGSVSDFTPGTEATVLDTGVGFVSTNICYESVYPWLSRAFVQHGSQLLGIITNDAWFGTSSAAAQHFDQGAIRAVEEGRYVVRAANTGISGVVDPYGRVLTATPLFVSTAFVADVRLLDGRTLYGLTGDWVAWIAAAITVGLVFLGWRHGPR